MSNSTTKTGAPKVSGAPPNAVEELARALRLRFPSELVEVWTRPIPEPLTGSVYLPLVGASPPAVFYAITMMRRGVERPPRNLLPIHLVDEMSFACVVCAREGEDEPEGFGTVVRWHLGEVPARARCRQLDVDALSYIDSAARAEGAMSRAKKKVLKLAHGYQKSGDKKRMIRPIRHACQNVVIGEAAWKYDAQFDGLAVHLWHTSQEPHVNAHEGARALAGMMLAEAFRTGGTMEVRFDSHPERVVPGALSQWARCQGIELDESRAVITPSQARELMLAATEMPPELARRAIAFVGGARLSVERACYTLLSGIWRPVELDFLLATTPRVHDILVGGSEPLNRPRRDAEEQMAGAAAMLGTLHQRLQQRRESSGSNVVEDDRNPVSWAVQPDHGTVRFEGFAGPLPWTDGAEADGALIVLPRMRVTKEDLSALESLSGDVSAAILTPADAAVGPLPEGRAHLPHPDRRTALLRSVEARLLASRVGRQ